MISISRTFEPISQRQSTELIAEKLGRGEEGRAALRLSSGQRLNFSPEGCARPHTYLLVRWAQKRTCGDFAHKRLEPGETEGILLEDDQLSPEAVLVQQGWAGQEAPCSHRGFLLLSDEPGASSSGTSCSIPSLRVS